MDCELPRECLTSRSPVARFTTLETCGQQQKPANTQGNPKHSRDAPTHVHTYFALSVSSVTETASVGPTLLCVAMGQQGTRANFLVKSRSMWP